MDNNITLTGNLTADPEIKYFDSGSVKTQFSVAVNRKWTDAKGEKQEQTSFVEVTAWKYLAEDSARVLQKGSRVTVSGRIEQQTWDDKESGAKRSKIIIVADDIAVPLSQIEGYERRKRSPEGEGQQSGGSRSGTAQKGSNAARGASQARVPATAGASRRPATSREELVDDEPF